VFVASSASSATHQEQPHSSLDQTALFDSLGWHSAVWIWACCGAMAVYDPPADSSAQSILQTLKRYWTVR